MNESHGLDIPARDSLGFDNSQPDPNLKLQWEDWPIPAAARERLEEGWSQPRWYFTKAALTKPRKCLLCGKRYKNLSAMGAHWQRSHGLSPSEKIDQYRLYQAADAETKTEPGTDETSALGAMLAVREAQASLALDGETQDIGPVTVGHGTYSEPNGIHSRPAIATRVVKAMFPEGVPVELIDDAYAFLNHADHVAQISGRE